MLQGWVVIAVALAYIGLLFLVASYGDRRRGLRHDGRTQPLYDAPQHERGRRGRQTTHALWIGAGWGRPGPPAAVRQRPDLRPKPDPCRESRRCVTPEGTTKQYGAARL